jgi:activator of HSP90 ATPase
MATSIHHDVTFDAAPERVYAALTDASQFAAFTNAPAEIDASPGGAISLFGGQIEGRNVELVDGELVVQQWRVAGWDPGLNSTVRFALSANGAGTALAFDHTEFPPEARDELDGGWTAMYWEPMKAFFARG